MNLKNQTPLQIGIATVLFAIAGQLSDHSEPDRKPGMFDELLAEFKPYLVELFKKVTGQAPASPSYVPTEGDFPFDTDETLNMSGPHPGSSLLAAYIGEISEAIADDSPITTTQLIRSLAIALQKRDPEIFTSTLEKTKLHIPATNPGAE